MQVTIYGPNLPRQYQDLGDFHVHAAGCQHGSRFPERGDTFEALDAEDIVTTVYPPEDFGYDPDSDEILDFLVSFHFAPCAKDLPRDRYGW